MSKLVLYAVLTSLVIVAGSVVWPPVGHDTPPQIRNDIFNQLWGMFVYLVVLFLSEPEVTWE